MWASKIYLCVEAEEEFKANLLILGNIYSADCLNTFI